MKKPAVSDFFNVDDIRRIREYNSSRHMDMTEEEILDDIKKGAVGIINKMKVHTSMKNSLDEQLEEGTVDEKDV